jgi:hypothetical protein
MFNIVKIVSGLISCAAVFGLLSSIRGSQLGTQTTNEVFWKSFRVDGMEVEHFESLSDMKKSADLVIEGALIDFRLSREIRTAIGEDSVAYGLATVRVSRVLKGQVKAETVPVEFLMPDSPEALSSRVADLESTLPAGAIVLFLRDKGGRESGLYRTVNSWGLWASGGRGVIAPLVEGSPEADNSRSYVAELAGISDVAGLSQSIANGK